MGKRPARPSCAGRVVETYRLLLRVRESRRGQPMTVADEYRDTRRVAVERVLQILHLTLGQLDMDHVGRDFLDIGALLERDGVRLVRMLDRARLDVDRPVLLIDHAGQLE